MFISQAWAQTAGATTMGASSNLISLVLIFLIFYFILIRPQQKKLKQHENMLAALQVKDKIVTGGGIYGTIIKIDGNIITVEIAEGVIVTTHRSSIRSLQEEQAPVIAPKKANKKDKK